MKSRILLATMLCAAAISSAELPDISTVAPISPAGNDRRETRSGPARPPDHGGLETTEVYHALYLPADWKPGIRFPVIVEWRQRNYRNAFAT